MTNNNVNTKEIMLLIQTGASSKDIAEATGHNIFKIETFRKFMKICGFSGKG